MDKRGWAFRSPEIEVIACPGEEIGTSFVMISEIQHAGERYTRSCKVVVNDYNIQFFAADFLEEISKNCAGGFPRYLTPRTAYY